MRKLWSGGGEKQITDHDIAVVLTDPRHAVKEVSLTKSTGEPIKAFNMRSVVNDFEQRRIFGFSEAIPADVRVKLNVIPVGKTVRVPFSFTDIALP
jgi:hypothetical protein